MVEPFLPAGFRLPRRGWGVRAPIVEPQRLSRFLVAGSFVSPLCLLAIGRSSRASVAVPRGSAPADRECESSERLAPLC